MYRSNAVYLQKTPDMGVLATWARSVQYLEISKVFQQIPKSTRPLLLHCMHARAPARPKPS